MLLSRNGLKVKNVLIVWESKYIPTIELVEVMPFIWRIKEIADALEIPLSELLKELEK